MKYQDKIFNILFAQQLCKGSNFNFLPAEIKHLKAKNKKVIGKFKDELNGEPMLEFVSLRAKMYSFRTSDQEAKKLKGIKKSVVTQDLHFQDYKDYLKIVIIQNPWYSFETKAMQH